MKKILLIFLVAAGTACTSSGPATETEKTTETKNTDPAHSHNEAESSSLTLNNGNKWKLDDGTRKNIGIIRTHLESKEPSDPARRAEILQKDADTLIAECRMQGKDHDALHQWLEGFLKKLNEYKKEGSEEAVQDLRKSLVEFDAFFE